MYISIVGEWVGGKMKFRLGTPDGAGAWVRLAIKYNYTKSKICLNQNSTLYYAGIHKLSQVGWLRRLCGGMVAEAMWWDGCGGYVVGGWIN